MTDDARALHLVRALDSDRFVYTTSDGTRIDVEADGPAEAGVSVVFVHGFTLNMTSFRNQRVALAAAGDVRRVFYDQRGFGTSERGPRSKVTLTRLADDLAELVEAAPGRVVLVGHSMGGMVIMELARVRPDLFGGKVRGNVLIATTSSGAEIDLHGLEPIVKLVGARLLRGLHRARPVMRLAGRTPFDLAAWLFHDPRAARSDRRAFAEMVKPNRLDVLADYLTAMLTYDARDSLAELGRTATVVIAPKSDLVTPVAAGRRLVAAIPGSQLVIVPRAGHMVTFEAARVVNDAISDVIARIQTGR